MTTPATLTRDQLADIGAHTVLMCGTFQALGHVSPTGSAMDYVGPMDSESAEFVRCMFRVCVFGGDPSPAEKTRVAKGLPKYGRMR